MSEDQNNPERVPSFEELDASLNAHLASHGRPSLSMIVSPWENAHTAPQLPLTYNLPPPSMYPMYPIMHDTSDMSLNAFQTSGFESQGIFTHHGELMPVISIIEPFMIKPGHGDDASSPSTINQNTPVETNKITSPTSPTVDPLRPRTRQIAVTFSDVAAHTAKCDEGNERNRDGMSRCNICGWQICRACINRRAGDRSHSSFGSRHVEETSKRQHTDSTPRQGAVRSGPVLGAHTSVERRASVDLGSGSGPHAGDHTSDEASAARALVNLICGRAAGSAPAAAGGRQTGASAGKVTPEGERRTLPFRKRKHSCDESWSASEVTLRPAAKTDLTSASVSASQPMDEPEVPIGDDGLPLQYQITRRNPKRRARPSSRMAE